MKKYVVEFTNQNGVKSSNTFDKESKMINFIKMAFEFGISSINVKQFKVTTNE